MENLANSIVNNKPVLELILESYVQYCDEAGIGKRL